jgi:putative ABC transport system permease protein
MLLVAASLMIRTLIAIERVDLGIRVDRLLTMRVPLSDRRYPTPERRVAFFDELLRRVTAAPGVLAVGLNTGVHPMGNVAWPIEVVGGAQRNAQPVLVHQINPDYPRALGIGFVAGRPLSETDLNARSHVALVNESLVRQRLAGADPLGRMIRIPRLSEAPFALTDDSFQVVGVVKDTTNRTLNDVVMPELYLPFTILGAADRLVMLTRADPGGLTHALMDRVHAVDKDQPVTEVQTMERILQDHVYAGPRFNLVLFSVFAAIGLALAIVGIYGVMSNSVAQQEHEIGVRMALGADSGTIASMVLTRGSRLLLAGIGLGLAGSVATVRLLETAIWHVSPFDPVSFAAVSLTLLVVGLLACLWPARRAISTDPIVALRTE